MSHGPRRGMLADVLEPGPVLLAAAAFDALPAQAVVLDADGVVVLTNDAWRESCRRAGAGPACGVGASYLDVCARAAAGGDELAGVVEAALRAVLGGHAPRAELDYPCHTPQEQRWFHLLARPVEADDPRAGVLVLHDEVSSRVREVAQLRHAATHDPLTGLANRALLQERLETALRRRDRRAETAVAVLVVDVDGFKLVNDRHGHLAGDALLGVLGERLRALGRAADTVARWGGDEFVLVLPGCGAEAAERRRAQVAQAVALPVVLPAAARGRDGAVLQVTASVGVAVGAAGKDAGELLAQADRALLADKVAGRAARDVPGPRRPD